MGNSVDRNSFCCDVSDAFRVSSVQMRAKTVNLTVTTPSLPNIPNKSRCMVSFHKSGRTTESRQLWLGKPDWNGNIQRLIQIYLELVNADADGCHGNPSHSFAVPDNIRCF